jgi:hypothetical protein
MEEGSWALSEKGTPQGATVSPLLGNVFLHYVFDLWVQQWRKKHARGDVIVVRFADDFIVGFQHRDDAMRFQRALQDRLGRFSLELHPDKTRLLEFGRFAARDCRARGRKPDSFEFLGFTHICGTTRGGKYLLLRHTSRKRMRAKLSTVKAELMRRRHLPIPAQGAWLASVVRGHFAYYAVPTNVSNLGAFRTQTTRHWLSALRRRSQRSRMTWPRLTRLADRWLPPAQVLLPWPTLLFDARTRGRSPVR